MLEDRIAPATPLSLKVELNDQQLRQLIAEALSAKGYLTTAANVVLHFSKGDRPFDADSFSASAKCEPQP